VNAVFEVMKIPKEKGQKSCFCGQIPKENGGEILFFWSNFQGKGGKI